MKRIAVAAAFAAIFTVAGLAEADELKLRRAWEQDRVMRSQNNPWHGAYYHPAWGTPVALVVPPRTTLQTNWGWGVGNTRVSRINHQFARPYPGPYAGGQGFRGRPQWPSDTTQFGVHYVRAPW